MFVFIGSLCKESFSGQVSSSSLMPLTPFWTLLQSNVPVLQPPPPAPKMPPPEKTKKGKKDKAKKSKTKMPSLVKKWQSIQRELDEEENSSSSEEDRESTAQKRIEEWKQQQLVSGMAERNANFEALPEDWRARLKRRKMAPNT